MGMSETPFTHKCRKNSGLLHAYSVKGCQPIYDYRTAYMPLIIKWSVRLILDLFLGQFVQKIIIFAKNEEKKVVYCMPTLLKDLNLFIITAYMPLTINWRLNFRSLLYQFAQKTMFFCQK